jgi:hypothetical protein
MYKHNRRENHEGTKKHQERLTKLIAELEDDEAMLGGDGDGDGDGDWDGAQSAESSSPDAEDTDTPDEASLGRDKAGTARSDEANHQVRAVLRCRWMLGIAWVTELYRIVA